MVTIIDLFPVSVDGKDLRAGILMFPDDYRTNPEKCPLIVVWHGWDEAAAKGGSLDDVSKLFLNGTPLAQAQAGLLNTITCPVTGKVIRPAVFALQGITGGCVPAIPAIVAIKLLLAKYSMIDPAGMLATGLSIGGETTFEAMGSTDARMFAAGFPLSCAPSVSPSVVNWNGQIGLVWARHGNTDTGGITDKSNSSKAVDAINGAKPNTAYYLEYQGGHNGWPGQYIPSNRVVLPVTANGTPVTKAINAYEFWAMCRNGKVLFTASGTDSGTGGTNASKVSTKAIAKATYDQATKTITLDGTGSTGSASWNWAVTYPDGSVNRWYAYGSGTPPLKTISNAAAGAYTFVLEISDNAGFKDSATVALQAGAGGGSVVPVAKTILIIVTNPITGKQTTVYTDDSNDLK